MVGYSPIPPSYNGLDGASLQALAERGNPRAVFELRRRGVPVAALGSDRGPEGFGMKFMNAINQRPDSSVPGMDVAPPYLDRGADNPGGWGDVRRDMARPSNQPDYSKQPLDFMSAFQQQQAPDYLGTGLMRPGETAGDDAIKAIANGNDAAGVIQRGAAAAAADAGAPGAEPGDAQAPVPGAIGALAKAYIDHDEAAGEDPNEGYVQKIIQGLMGQADPQANRMNALAQAGFAMAASGSPYFFQAAGIGGQAGMQAWQQYKDRDTFNQIKAATLAGDASDRARRAKALEDEAAYRRANLEEETRYHDVLAQQQRDELQQRRIESRMNQAYQQGMLGVSSQNAATAAQQAAIEQHRFEEEQRRYNEGLSDAQALRKAQIRAENAQAAASEANATDRNTQYIYAADGVYARNNANGETIPVMGKDGKQLQAMPKGGSSWAAKQQALAAAGWTTEQIAEVAAGRKPLTQIDIENAATRAAQAKAQGATTTRQYNETYQAEHDRMVQVLTESGDMTPPPVTTTPPPAASTGAASSMSGSGTTADPWKGATQADVDWFKKNGKKGDVITVNGVPYTHQ